ncbi:unnamed protein product [Caretta caretta]
MHGPKKLQSNPYVIPSAQPIGSRGCNNYLVIYASNYDNVSRPCSSSAAGFQPEIGYQSLGQRGELSVPWRRSPAKDGTGSLDSLKRTS